MIDILQHELVPKHEILTDQEKKEILARFSIIPENLPKILTSDPIIKHIKAKPGDIIRILRESLTAGEAEYYRLVVEE